MRLIYDYMLHRLRRQVRQSIGSLLLSAEEDTPCADAGSFYALVGTFTNGNFVDFTLDEDTGILTYTGTSGKIFTFFGVSDLKSSKVCQGTYAAFINDTLVETAQTPHTFSNVSSYTTISIVRPVELNNGDTLQVKAKSDTANTTFTVATLSVVLIGVI